MKVQDFRELEVYPPSQKATGFNPGINAEKGIRHIPDRKAHWDDGGYAPGSAEALHASP